LETSGFEQGYNLSYQNSNAQSIFGETKVVERRQYIVPTLLVKGLSLSKLRQVLSVYNAFLYCARLVRRLNDDIGIGSGFLKVCVIVGGRNRSMAFSWDGCFHKRFLDAGFTPRRTCFWLGCCFQADVCGVNENMPTLKENYYK